MSLAPLRGHAVEREMLARAVAKKQLPAALLIHGAAGIGKQRLALWLAQLLVCEDPGAEPCGRCRACHLASHLEHPDVHWFFPLPRPRVSGGADRLGDALEDARAAELEARRKRQWASTNYDEPVGLYLAHVQVLRRIAASRPAMGHRKVFVVGDAEALVPQEASPEAANALLKVLEEPPSDTTIIVTASDPQSLLPTIRSRLTSVRLRPLPIEEVAAFLEETLDVERAVAERVARLAGGSIGRALAFLPDGSAPGPLEELRVTARALLEAAVARTPAARLGAAHAQPPAGARGAFVVVLTFLADWLRDLAAVAVGAEANVLNADALEWLREVASRIPEAAARVPRAIHAVDAAAAATQLNLNPQLAVASLLQDVTGALYDGSR